MEVDIQMEEEANEENDDSQDEDDDSNDEAEDEVDKVEDDEENNFPLDNSEVFFLTSVYSLRPFLKLLIL